MKPIALFVIFAGALCAQTTAAINLQSSPGPNGRFAAPRPPASFDCSADGTVVNAVTGEPIARARIDLVDSGTTYSASTDSTGNWALSNVGCAGAVLQVTRTGFLQGIGAPPQNVQLVSGSPIHGLRTKLTPQSVVVGKVLDDQGDPIQSVQVSALISRVVDGRLRFQPAGTTNTNDIGEYRLHNLQRGRYFFCVHVNGPATASGRTMTGDSCYPGPIEGGIAGAMDVPAGRESKIDFNLNQIVPVHIKGTITGMPEGRRLGLTIRSASPNADQARNYPVAIHDDQFDARVPPGSYVITADYFEAGKRLSARVPVNAGSSDIDNVVVHLDPGFTVTGVIRASSESGAAVPQFQATLRPVDSNGAAGQFRWDDGRTSFTISDVVPGNYRLQINPPRPFYVKSATLAGQDILNSDIPISQAAGPIEIALRDDGGTIEGDITDAAGQPVQANVILLRGSTRVAIGFAPAGGHFKLPNLPPGDYTVYAWDDVNQVQYAEPDWMRRYGTGGVAVSVAAGQTAQTKLTEQLVPAP